MLSFRICPGHFALHDACDSVEYCARSLHLFFTTICLHSEGACLELEGAVTFSATANYSSDELCSKIWLCTYEPYR